MPYRARALAIALSFAVLASLGALPGAGPDAAAASTPKVAIIVGPTEITDSHYHPSAKNLKAVAEAAGATVDLRYCPTAAEAKAAVNGANVIVYFGHGNGFPNPYTTPANSTDPSKKLTDRTNGWGLRSEAKKPNWDGKSCRDEVLQYYGEDHLTGKLSTLGWGTGPITPAPGFVMVMSNACYAPGAGEARPAPAEEIALARVAHYSNPFLSLGGTYFATDMGSARIVDLLLRNPGESFGRIFEQGNGFDASALRRYPHPMVGGTEAWVHRTHYQWLGDDYWFAFAGDPGKTPSGSKVGYSGPAPAAPFSDIVGSKFYSDIIWLSESGITSGCGNGKFCPDGLVTRSQMASFIARAMNLPPTSVDHFTDDNGSKHEDNINRLASAGVTSGCGSGRYCPDGVVARDQMASFIARAMGLQPSWVDHFTDDNGNKHEPNINAFAGAGITSGCGGGKFCPAGGVTRGQMAAFLYRAFGKK
ncbi:MAG TPA: S-layer homology domain-containing protein [Candidatus Angelobacter sp.]|nr:S-layer homology domain-containing protein [Candidatus Angelobacter sp.]